MGENKLNHIQSLSRALAILGAVSQSPIPLSLTNLSRQLHLTMSTVQRLVNTLEHWGYLARESETKRYLLGPRLISIGWSVLRASDLRKVASPILEDLSVQIGEGASLARMDGIEIVYLVRTRTQHVISFNLQVGDRFPLYCTSIGKAILAFQPSEHLDKLFEKIQFIALTPTTITSKEKLREELRKIRERGFSINNEELAVGARSVAVPIRNYNSEVTAAVSIGVPSFRATLEKLESFFAPRLIETANRISFHMGYTGK